MTPLTAAPPHRPYVETNVRPSILFLFLLLATGLSADEVLAIPADFPQSIGLTRVVSPLRISGMTGMLMRAKRQVAAKRPGPPATA